MIDSIEQEVARKASLSTLGAVALIGVLYVYAQGTPDLLYLVSNGLPPLLAFVPLAIAGTALRKTGVKREERLSWVWLGFTLGLLLWFLGEATWAVYALLLGVPIPFPSIADAFWLLGYVPFLFALLFQLWPFREALTLGHAAAGVASGLILSTVVLVALIPSTYGQELDFSTMAVSLAYPVLDAILLSIAIPTYLVFMKGTFWKPLLLVTVGMLFTLLGDAVFGLAILEGTYYDGQPLELLFHWGYLAFALGFYLRLKQT